MVLSAPHILITALDISAPSCERSTIKTLRATKRLLTELPQPARTFQRCFFGFFLGTFLLLVITNQKWFALGISAAGFFLVLFGLQVFRDSNETASTWSKIYKESREISPESFTFADVPTIKGMGFMYMLMGVFFAAVGVGLAAT
ncbi:hypothetical protein [Paenarthrobacter sp. NPDC018779]|uniref:hypothetical protein n=1 Tax=Paenarthrobacter sp. NPDC018779 TaxID=3364375 RepID=UPI0037C8DDAA